MYYRVSARPIPDAMPEFHRKLTDGTIAAQKPDGREIVASMARARVDPDGAVRWGEQCFCATPLQHERETVYDRYFTDLRTEPADGYIEAEGEPFMDVLARLSPRTP